jgi:hypothetical protein
MHTQGATKSLVRGHQQNNRKRTWSQNTYKRLNSSTSESKGASLAPQQDDRRQGFFPEGSRSADQTGSLIRQKVVRPLAVCVLIVIDPERPLWRAYGPSFVGLGRSQSTAFFGPSAASYALINLIMYDSPEIVRSNPLLHPPRSTELRGTFPGRSCVAGGPWGRHWDLNGEAHGASSCWAPSCRQSPPVVRTSGPVMLITGVVGVRLWGRRPSRHSHIRNHVYVRV